MSTAISDDKGAIGAITNLVIIAGLLIPYELGTFFPKIWTVSHIGKRVW